MPTDLRREIYDVVRTRTDRVEIHHASLTDFLGLQPSQSVHRFVLLDAQNWMPPEMLVAQRQQIDRIADGRDVRVIFHTGGTDSPLPRKLPAELLAPWRYLEERSTLHARDGSSIYGGFHLYHRRALS